MTVCTSHYSIAPNPYQDCVLVTPLCLTVFVYYCTVCNVLHCLSTFARLHIGTLCSPVFRMFYVVLYVAPWYFHYVRYHLYMVVMTI